MKGWQLTDAYDLEQIKKTEPLKADNKIKVRITKVMLSQDDITLYNGDDKPLYPLIPGRFAIGIVVDADANPYGIEKDMRVYIDPVFSCNNCYACTIGQPKDCFRFNVAGRNTDGFLRDFAVFPFDRTYPLPKGVSDTEALFIDYLSLAISVIDKLKIEKGEHVAVIGGNVIGNIIAQLIIYYQAVPIIIDDNDADLEIAKRSGIYYTLKADTRLEKEVAEITGGRMPPKVVYVTSCGINTENAIRISRTNATVAFAGFNNFTTRVNLSQAMQKQLRFYCITNGYANAETSINLIANHAINISTFNLASAKFADIPSIFRNGDENLKNGVEVPNVIVDMLS